MTIEHTHFVGDDCPGGHVSLPDLPLTTREVAEVVMGVSPQEVEMFVHQLTDDKVAEFLIRAEAIAKLASFGKKAATAELVIRELDGRTFTDPADQTHYKFVSSSRSRKVKDQESFMLALDALGVRVRDLIPWLGRGAIKVGADIEGDIRVKDTVTACAEWVNGSPALIELDERGKPRRK